MLTNCNSIHLEGLVALLLQQSRKSFSSHKLYVKTKLVITLAMQKKSLLCATVGGGGILIVMFVGTAGSINSQKKLPFTVVGSAKSG